MSTSEEILTAVRERRTTRDRIMFENILIPAISQLRATVNTWIDEELPSALSQLDELITYIR